MLLCSLLVGSFSGCGDPSTGRLKPAQAAQTLADPLEGLASNTSGSLVAGATMYWVASGLAERVQGDNSEVPFSLVNAVRRFDAREGAWRELPDLPSKQSPKIVSTAGVGDALAVLFRDCEGRRIDPDDDPPRECTRTVLATIDGAADRWQSVDAESLLGLSESGVSPTERNFSLHAMNDELLIESWSGDAQQTIVLVDPDDLTASRLLDPAPSAIASRFSLDGACAIESGLLVWTPNFQADGEPVDQDPSDPIGVPRDGGIEVNGIRTSVLARDGHWSEVAVTQGYVPFPDALGCAAEGVILRARQLDPAIAATEQRVVPVVVSTAGVRPQASIDLGADPRAESHTFIEPNAHPPAIIHGTTLLIYVNGESGAVRCTLPSEGGLAVMTTDAQVVMYSSRAAETTMSRQYKRLECR